MGWDKTGRDGMGLDGMGWDRMGWDGIGWDRMGYGMGMAADAQMHSQPAPARVRRALSPRPSRSQTPALSDVRGGVGRE